MRIVAKETVSFLCREVLQQLSVQRISLLHDGRLGRDRRMLMGKP